MAINCGNCGGQHDSVRDVKTCHDPFHGLTQNPEEFRPAPTTDPRSTFQGAPATEKQISFIKSLLNDRDATFISDSRFLLTANAVAGDKPVSKNAASDLITALKECPKQQGSTGQPAAELEDGVYVHGDDTFKIVHAVHGSGQQYAKRLVKEIVDGEVVWSWEYEGKKPLNYLRPEHRMSEEQAKKFGLLYGICINCARPLTREESIHVGYGATCARNNGWHYPTKAELKAMTKEANASA